MRQINLAERGISAHRALTQRHWNVKFDQYPVRMFSIDKGVITFRETPLPWALRGFIAVLVVTFGFVMPATCVSAIRDEITAPMLALLLVLIAGPLAFALFLLRVLLASAIELQIDPQSPDVLRIRRGLILNDRTEIPRHSFGPPEIVMRQTEDGPTPMLRLPLPVRGRIIESTNFMNRAEAEGWCRAIAAALRA